MVVERYVSPGEYVDGQPLLRVAQIDPLRVEVIIPAQIFGRIIPGMTATSLLPKAAGHAGLSFAELALQILEDAGLNK